MGCCSGDGRGKVGLDPPRQCSTSVFRGTWSNESALHPGHDIPTFHVGVDRMEIWPQMKVEKRLRNGPEDNVWHYFQLTVQKLAAR